MVTLRGVPGYSQVTSYLFQVGGALIWVYYHLLSVHKPIVSYHVPAALLPKKITHGDHWKVATEWRGRYWDSLRTGRSGIRNPEGRFLQTRPLWPWGPSSLLHRGYWGSLPGVPGGALRPHTPFYRRGWKWYSYTSTTLPTALAHYGVSFTYHPTNNRSGDNVKFASVHRHCDVLVMRNNSFIRFVR